MISPMYSYSLCLPLASCISSKKPEALVGTPLYCIRIKCKIVVVFALLWELAPRNLAYEINGFTFPCCNPNQLYARYLDLTQRDTNRALHCSWLVQVNCAVPPLHQP